MNLQVEKMIEDNKRLIYSIANSIYIKNKLFTKDDLIQVGFLALCKSGHKYDETRGKVSTFITHCVRNDMLKFIKSNKLQSDLIYSENKNLLAISRETKIPYRSLLKTIRKAKTLLKFKIRNNELD